jgi:hypothetical protein
MLTFSSLFSLIPLTTMNIATDPWLPVVLVAGRSEAVSLRDAFARAHEIRDLSLRPDERISVMRLLLCISHAALDGPANRKEWRACREWIAPAVGDYLDRTAQAFNLFGDSRRFLQVDLKPIKTRGDKSGSLSKLNFALATGSNATLFDPRGPLALDNLNGGEEFALWVGALVADRGKIIDALESFFPNVPPALLGDAGQRVYQDGVKYSEDAANRLWKAVFVYHKQIGNSLHRPDAKSRREILQRTAASRFWTETEQARHLLLALVKDSAEFGLKSNYGATRWGKAVLQAAHRAYQLTCPHETSRQMQAFVAGLKQLNTNQWLIQIKLTHLSAV